MLNVINPLRCLHKDWFVTYKMQSLSEVLFSLQKKTVKVGRMCEGGSTMDG